MDYDDVPLRRSWTETLIPSGGGTAVVWARLSTKGSRTFDQNSGLALWAIWLRMDAQCQSETTIAKSMSMLCNCWLRGGSWIPLHSSYIVAPQKINNSLLIMAKGDDPFLAKETFRGLSSIFREKNTWYNMVKASGSVIGTEVRFLLFRRNGWEVNWFFFNGLAGRVSSRCKAAK